MQQVFSNLPTRTETHVWEISGNPVSPVGVNLNVPFFLNLCHPGDLSATIFLLIFHWDLKFYQVFTEVVTFHQVVTRLWNFTRFSPSFHQVFTRFSPGFSTSVHQVFLTSFHKVFTKFSRCVQTNFTKFFHQVFTRFFTRFSPSFHQVFTKFSPGFHRVFTTLSPGSPSFENSPGLYQVFKKITRFSPGFGQMRFSIHFHHENT